MINCILGAEVLAGTYVHTLIVFWLGISLHHKGMGY